MRNKVSRYCLMMLAKIAFQACLIDRSSISPFRINELRAANNDYRRNCDRPPNLLRSLTPILPRLGPRGVTGCRRHPKREREASTFASTNSTSKRRSPIGFGCRINWYTRCSTTVPSPPCRCRLGERRRAFGRRLTLENGPGSPVVTAPSSSSRPTPINSDSDGPELHKDDPDRAQRLQATQCVPFADTHVVSPDRRFAQSAGASTPAASTVTASLSRNPTPPASASRR